MCLPSASKVRWNHNIELLYSAVCVDTEQCYGIFGTALLPKPVGIWESASSLSGAKIFNTV